MVLFFLIFVLVGCTANLSPDVNTNSGKDSLTNSQLPNPLDMAFLSNVAGNYAPPSQSTLVYTMTSNGFFFFTNQWSSSSFMLATNYGFYSAQSPERGIFTNFPTKKNNNSKKYIGFRYFFSNIGGKQTTNLGIEARAHDTPDTANSTVSYYIYMKK